MKIYPEDLAPVIVEELTRQAKENRDYINIDSWTNEKIRFDGEIDQIALAKRILEVLRFD